MKNPFKSESPVDKARGKVTNLEARLSVAREDYDAAKERLGYAASNTTHDEDPDLLRARTAMREASDRVDELTAGLGHARRALAEVEVTAAAERQATLAAEVVQLTGIEDAAALEVDTALANLATVYGAWRDANQAADAAAKGADPGAGRLRVAAHRYAYIGALWHHLPFLARLLELPFRPANKRLPFAEATGVAVRRDRADAPAPAPEQAPTLHEAQATA